MTTVEIALPDASAHVATKAGLLAPERIERMLGEGPRQERIERMKAARATLAAEPLPPMTPEEISAEIDAHIATSSGVRPVLDTNTAHSGLSWVGTPGRLIDAAARCRRRSRRS